MISLRPITCRLASRLRTNSLTDLAERTVQLSGGTMLSGGVPIMLPDEPDRIRAHHVDSSPDRNKALLAGESLSQGPTRMHMLRDVIISEGSVLASRGYDRIAAGSRRPVLTGSPDLIDEAALCSTYVNQRYFGHWLKDGLAHEQLAADRGLQPVVLDRSPWLHEPAYRELASLEARRVRFARFDRLWMLEDHEFNAHFVERYHRIRERVRERVRVDAKPDLRIFLARGEKGHGRGLANRMEVRLELAKRGFVVLVPEETDAQEMARVLSRARLIVSPEGSALAHAAVAAPRGAGLLAIIGAQHFNMTYKALSDALGFRFGLTIADASGDEEFNQPIGRLLRAIDLMESALAQPVAA